MQGHYFEGTKWIYILLIIILILSVLFVRLEKKSMALKKDIVDIEKKCNEQMSSLSESLASLKNVQSEYEELQKKFLDLNDSYELELSKYDNLSSSYNNINVKIEDTTTRFEKFKKEIEDSMSWFKTNSEINSIEYSDKLLRNIQIRCLATKEDKEYKEGECLIKLGCIGLVNEKTMHYIYRNDSNSQGLTDHLSSLHEFSENYGGDCEDYSLFFKAEINSLLNLCKSMKRDKVIFESFVPGNGKYLPEFGTKINEEETYYVPLSTRKTIDGYNFPVVACGKFFDLKTQQINGHCVIAFTKSQIINSSDISFLDGAVLVEAQSGRFIGNLEVGSGEFNIVNLDGNYLRDSNIYLIITDSDLIQYRKEFKQWQSYSDFLAIIDSFEMKQ